MQELLEQFMGYVRGAWRFRWYIHLIAWPLCIGGWAVVHTLPDQYEASTRVYVDTESVLRPLLRGLAVQSNLGQEVQLITRTLLSRPNLEKVARMTDMDLTATTPEAMEGLLDQLHKKIKLSSQRRENLYTIYYMNEDPVLAKQVVQSLLTLFVETSLGDSRKDASTAQRFLDEQIQEYESRLLAAEEQLKEFKIKNVGLMPESGRDYYQRLESAMTQLSEAELELNEATKRRDELQRQLSKEKSSSGVATLAGAQSVNTALDERIQGLHVRLDDLLLKYTNNHPDVVSITRTIADLEKKKQEELEQIKQSAVDDLTGANANPVYQQIKISLGETEATVASLGVRVRQFRAKITDLKNAVDTIPKVEAALKNMNRDYEINKKNYDTLLTRRESAKMSQEAGQTSDNVKFRVIDPPRVPSSPAAPNRPLLASAVLVAGLLAGLGFALFMSQVRPAFDGARVVKHELGLPVFGSVSRVWNGVALRRRRMEVAAFGAGGLMLMSVYGAYMAYQLLSGGAA